MDLIDIFRTFHSMQKNIPSSQVHMEHSPGQTTSWVTNQTSVNKKTEIISSISSDHNALIVINYMEKKKKNLKEMQTHRDQAIRFKITYRLLKKSKGK